MTSAFARSARGVAFAEDVLADDSEVGAFAFQLMGLGYAEASEGGYVVPWRSVHEVLAEDPDAARLWGLPPSRPDIVPMLKERGTLGDGLRIALAGWSTKGSASLLAPYNAAPVGAVVDLAGVGEVLLSAEVTELLAQIRTINTRTEAERTLASSRRLWAVARRQALAAGAHLSPYLQQTIVLIPEHLQLTLQTDGDGDVKRTIPTFEGDPGGWLEAFERPGAVQQAYRVQTPEGEVQIFLDDQVHEVLTELKQQAPHLRVAGGKADQLARNPFSLLGEAATGVVDEEYAERQLELIESRSHAFTVTSEGVFVQPIEESEPDVFEPFNSVLDLHDFCRLYGHANDSGRIEVAWREHRLRVDAHGAALVDGLRAGQALVSPVDIGALSERIKGVGIEEKYELDDIRPTSGGWIPDEVPEVEHPPALEDEREDEERASKIRLTHDDIEGIDRVVRNLPADVPSDEVVYETEAGDRLTAGVAKAVMKSYRRTLVALANVEAVDYAEQRAADFRVPEGVEPRLPASLKREIALKDHQYECVAWLQHLATVATCRGALLADDMGLGKTLQALTFIASLQEQYPAAPPALVVAPVSLLENWQQECRKFFEDGTFRPLALTADVARRLKAHPLEISAEDRDLGLVVQLVDGWAQGSNLVVTTYETLRTYEVSFSRQQWSVVVLDEAQAIKNPNAMRTRSVWKLNAGFKIACTGTPVENSLTDLWSIFDFVQPSLLGSAREFNRAVAQAIANGDEARARRLQQLRDLIGPQVLRRMKEDVARDLPPKVFDESCRGLVMSEPQRRAYMGLLEQWMSEPAGTRKEMVTILQEMAVLNSDFSLRASEERELESADELAAVNPKFAWLIEQLDTIRGAGEKVLIFVERKKIQRTLARHINQRYGLRVSIINGDTTTKTTSADSRQALIDAFGRAPGFDVMILSPVAAGVGLNIQVANHVIHYMRHWNPAKEDQATDRAYRIGQTRPVTVYAPIVRIGGGIESPSFDERLDELLTAKRGLARDMLHVPEEVSASELGDLLA